MSDKQLQGQKVWFVTQEPTKISHLSTDGAGLSLVGLFTDQRKAMDYLRDEVLGDERYSTIEWESAMDNPTYWRGQDSDGYVYIISVEEVQ